MMKKYNNYVADEQGNCLNYNDGCWTCVYFSIYGQHHCKRPNQRRTYSTTTLNGDRMTEKRLCVIDGCEYCPYLEKQKITKKIKENHLIDAEYYKCNKTLLCVENGKLYLKDPLGLLFKYCPLPNSMESSDD